MKVLLVVPALGPVHGGPSIVVPALAAALAAQNVTVDIVTTDANGLDRLNVSTDSWHEENGYRVRYFRRLGRSEYKICPSLLLWLIRHVPDYDVVHGALLFNFPILACALACRLRSIPLVLSSHGVLEPWALSHKKWKKWPYYVLIEKPLVLHAASAIHALTNNEARNIAALELGKPIFVIPNGVNLDLHDTDAPVEEFFNAFPAARGKRLILFLHRIDPKKGLDLLAKSFAAVHRQFDDTHLIVAGHDLIGYWPVAHDLFKSAGCDSAVTYTGMLEGILKRAAFAVASIFVTPSYSEGFSISVLEAMAVGLPCVLTTGCNFPEAAAANAAVEVPVDSEALATAVGRLLANPAEAQSIGQCAREFIDRDYTWDAIARKVSAAYEAILCHRTVPYSLSADDLK